MSTCYETISQNRLKEVLSYDENTGLFTWVKVNKLCRVKVGDLSSQKETSGGYLKISVDGKTYYAHRLAWFYVYGYFPESNIDHINGNRKDNRIANLRDVSQQLNAQNETASRSNNTSGFKGVSWSRHANSWCAGITLDGKRKHLGYFKDPVLASQYYLETKRKLHEGFTL